HPLLDDPPHQAIVPRLAVFPGRLLVPEVMRFVDDDKIVVTPVDVREVDIAGDSSITREVRMVEDVVVEAVRREDIPTVVGPVQGPVVPKALRAEDENAVIPQLVVLDDGKSLEGFSEAHAIRDDASSMALQLVDGSDGPVSLELEELPPDDGVPDTCCRLDDLVLVELVPEILEEVKERQVVDEGGLFVLE